MLKKKQDVWEESNDGHRLVRNRIGVEYGRRTTTHIACSATVVVRARSGSSGARASVAAGQHPFLCPSVPLPGAIPRSLSNPARSIRRTVSASAPAAGSAPRAAAAPAAAAKVPPPATAAGEQMRPARAVSRRAAAVLPLRRPCRPCCCCCCRRRREYLYRADVLRALRRPPAPAASQSLARRPRGRRWRRRWRRRQAAPVATLDGSKARSVVAGRGWWVSDAEKKRSKD